MNKSKEEKSITLSLSEREHRLVCHAVRLYAHDRSLLPESSVEVQKLRDDIAVNGAAFHTTPELCTHPIEFLRREDRRWPTLDRDTDAFYARYVCDVCGSKRVDVENEDGGTLQEGEWEAGS